MVVPEERSHIFRSVGAADFRLLTTPACPLQSPEIPLKCKPVVPVHGLVLLTFPAQSPAFPFALNLTTHSPSQPGACALTPWHRPLPLPGRYSLVSTYLVHPQEALKPLCPPTREC